MRERTVEVMMRVNLKALRIEDAEVDTLIPKFYETDTGHLNWVQDLISCLPFYRCIDIGLSSQPC